MAHLLRRLLKMKTRFAARSPSFGGDTLGTRPIRGESMIEGIGL